MNECIRSNVEMQLMWSLLQYPRDWNLDEVRALDATDIYDQELRKLFKAAKELYGRDKFISPNLIWEQYPDLRDIVNRVVSGNGMDSSTQWCAKQVTWAAYRRSASRVMYDFISDPKSDELDRDRTDKYISRTLDIYRTFSTRMEGNDTVNIRQLMTDYCDRMDSNDPSGGSFCMGWDAIDRVLFLKRGSLSIIAGRPS